MCLAVLSLLHVSFHSVILCSHSVNPQKVTYKTMGYRIDQKYIYVNNCHDRH